MTETVARPSRFPDAPPNVRDLPLDKRGFPVPWFTPWFDGQPDFTAVAPERVALAVKKHVCWICGRPLGDVNAFVIGPMCAINRVSSEPPSHWLCGVFAAQACPFLTKPRMKRAPQTSGDRVEPPGLMIDRNPGVTLVWACTRFRTFHPDPTSHGILFDIGPPRRVAWYAEGRAATRAEVMRSIETGFPILEKAAQEGGQADVADLTQRYDRAMKLLPKAA